MREAPAWTGASRFRAQGVSALKRSPRRAGNCLDVPIIDRDTRWEPRRRPLTELEQEVHDLAERVDALLEAVSRMARQHYRSPLLPENSLSAAVHDAHRRQMTLTARSDIRRP